MIEIGELPGGQDISLSRGKSADGAVIVGVSGSAAGREAFRWSASDGMLGLGDLPGGDFSSTALNCSADGSVAVGFSSSQANSPYEAFRWTSSGGMQGLGDLPGGDFSSTASAISADGQVVVGASAVGFSTHAFAWTSESGMIDLGVVAGSSSSGAQDVSGDGSVIVGQSDSARAFIWDQAHGMRDLQLVISQEYGIDLTGWRLGAASAISDDGFTIAGNGEFNGQQRGWVFHVPEPQTCVLLIAFACVLIVGRRTTAA